MKPWDFFAFFALVSLLCWAGGAWQAWHKHSKTAIRLTTVGLLVFMAYMGWMWGWLERPPLRTLGETRLWYAFFLPLMGLLVYARWGYRWILSFATILATVFMSINLLRPEIHTKALMPALQSPWFAPHVIVYMFAYALLGAATLMALYQLWKREKEGAEAINNLVYGGLAFLTVGMLMGALWAKEAWGHYWSWDPKETWAAVTWLAYLMYIHYTLLPHHKSRYALWLLVVAFVLLQVTWWGINYLPSAQGASVHVYSNAMN